MASSSDFTGRETLETKNLPFLNFLSVCSKLFNNPQQSLRKRTDDNDTLTDILCVQYREIGVANYNVQMVDE